MVVAKTRPWIDPDFLEVKFDDVICTLCFGVMDEPTSGCPDGHSFCSTCINTELRIRKKFPLCRHIMADGPHLVRNRPLEGMISQLRVKCPYGPKQPPPKQPPPTEPLSMQPCPTQPPRKQPLSGEPRCVQQVAPESASDFASILSWASMSRNEPVQLVPNSTSKRAKVVPSASMSLEELKQEMRDRCLVLSGTKAVLAARLESDRDKKHKEARTGEPDRLEEDRKKKDLKEEDPKKEDLKEEDPKEEAPKKEDHKEEDTSMPHPCGWVGSVGTFAAHSRECPWAPVTCPNVVCNKTMPKYALPGHKAKCSNAIKCPNYGCAVSHRSTTMNQHLSMCIFEKVTCPSPGCGLSMLRRDLRSHVSTAHFGPGKPDPIQTMIHLWNCNVWQHDANVSEQRLAIVPNPVVSHRREAWVFNWQMDSWAVGTYLSRQHDFGQGATGLCGSAASTVPDRTHFFGVCLKGLTLCRLHITVTILDKYDNAASIIWVYGKPENPVVRDLSTGIPMGVNFTPSPKLKDICSRRDGSVRVRTVVHVFRSM